MADEVQTIELGGETYRLSYANVIEQTVDDDSLIASIKKEGMIYPIVYRKTKEGREIIDGNTRARLVAEGKVELDDIPLEEVEVNEDEHAYDLAIQLNFQRRQISPSYRRKTIEQVHEHKNWRGKPSSHVKELSELLGVSRATISQDLSKLWAEGHEGSLREERTKINYLLTGLGYLDGEDLKGVDLSDQFSDDEIETGDKYMKALKKQLEARRSEINQALKSTDKPEDAA